METHYVEVKPNPGAHDALVEAFDLGIWGHA